MYGLIITTPLAFIGLAITLGRWLYTRTHPFNSAVTAGVVALLFLTSTYGFLKNTSTEYVELEKRHQALLDDNIELVEDNQGLLDDNIELVEDNHELVEDNRSLVIDNRSLVNENRSLLQP